MNGKSTEVSGFFSTYPLVNFEHFDINIIGAADCDYMVVTKKPPKNEFYGG